MESHSSQDRDDQLQLRRERDRARHAVETADQRELQLWQQQECYRARHTALSSDERERTLQQQLQWDTARCTVQTLEESTLQRMCTACHDGLAAETGCHFYYTNRLPVAVHAYASLRLAPTMIIICLVHT